MNPLFDRITDLTLMLYNNCDEEDDFTRQQM